MSSITVTASSLDGIDEVRPLLALVAQKPYRFLGAQFGSELDDYWLTELAATIADGQSELFLARQDRRPVGIAMLAPLPWETRVLARPMGTLKHLAADPNAAATPEILNRLLEEADHRAQDRGFHALLCKTYTDDMSAIHALEAHGYRLMDTLLDFMFDYRRYSLRGETASVRQPRPAPDVRIRLAERADETALLAIAQASFAGHFGRFHADERISAFEATSLYVEWIRSCLHGYADWILLAEIDGRIAGYTAWKKTTPLEQNLPVRVGHYSIAGIHPDFAGRGLFSILTYEGMQRFDGLVDLVEGPTHVNNYPVQRGYANLNWRIADARHAFHKWFEPQA